MQPSILQCSAFFMVQLTSVHDYWENHSFDYMDICWQSDTVSRFVIAILPRNKHLLLSRLQSLSAVILEPKKIKFLTVSIVSPSIHHEVMGPDALYLSNIGCEILHSSKFCAIYFSPKTMHP